MFGLLGAIGGLFGGGGDKKTDEKANKNYAQLLNEQFNTAVFAANVRAALQPPQPQGMTLNSGTIALAGVAGLALILALRS